MGPIYAHIQRMKICHAKWLPQSRDGLRKQLSRLVLELQQVIGSCRVEYLPQGWPVWLKEKELFPKTL